MSYMGVPETSVHCVICVTAKSHLQLFTVAITNIVRIIYCYLHFLFIFVKTYIQLLPIQLARLSNRYPTSIQLVPNYPIITTYLFTCQYINILILYNQPVDHLSKLVKHCQICETSQVNISTQLAIYITFLSDRLTQVTASVNL